MINIRLLYDYSKLIRELLKDKYKKQVGVYSLYNFIYTIKQKEENNGSKIKIWCNLRPYKKK